VRVIVFDDETMEPITAVTLPLWMTELLRLFRLGSVVSPVQRETDAKCQQGYGGTRAIYRRRGGRART
jgi:hypothetical protein